MNTMQYEFDQVVAHLYKQGKPAKSYFEDGVVNQCLYRAGSLSCAVGCRIPDEVYKPEMDIDSNSNGTGVHNLVSVFGPVLPPEIVMYKDMFSSLQSVHDMVNLDEENNFNLTALERELASVAKSYDLTFTKPEVNNG